MGDNMKKTAAHYKGLAAGAKRMQDMGHTTASGGGSKPPKGCLRKLFAWGLGGVGVVGYALTVLLQDKIG